MPATRSSGKASTSRIHPTVASSDDVIIISSDEEDMNSREYALRKAQQEVRSLKKLLVKEASGSQVLSDQGNHTGTSSRLKKSEEERLRLETRLHEATTEIDKLQTALRTEKALRNGEVAQIKQLKKRTKAAELEIASLKAVNGELRNNTSRKGQNKVLQDLENHILCEVCTERLWQPYTLSECGHTFCQGCLTDWFNTAIAANAFHPQYTCPICRAPVHQKPSEDYTLKGVVRAIVQAIDPTGGSPAAPPRSQTGRGPWFRFFGD